jgi:CDP-6-deoxy-D-xylo-4-hexulose-3-dehydrase
VFVDVDLNTFNISIEQIQKAITKKTVAILAVNLLGLPCKMTELNYLCKKHDLYLIEDNCESLGALYNGKQAGTFGIFGTFSFFFSHHLQTMEGGMVVTNDGVLADYMRSIRAHGWVRDLRTTALYKKGTVSEFQENFHFVLPGYCVRPLEMSGAIGSIQLKKMDRFIDARRKNAEVFVENFGNTEDIEIQRENGSSSSWFGFGVVLSGNRDRAQTIERLKPYVEVRPVVAGNFVNHPAMKLMKTRIVGDLENAEKIDKNGFFFGNDHRPLKNKIIRVRELLG